MTDAPRNVDLGGVHRELDELKSQLCHCQHTGQCIACRGFELLRQQLQEVVVAASQPVLMQVAQDVAVQDLMRKMGNAQNKLAEDPRMQELLTELMQRIQEDIGET